MHNAIVNRPGNVWAIRNENVQEAAKRGVSRASALKALEALNTSRKC